MDKIIIKEENCVIDLTDDPPNEDTAAEPDIEFVGETKIPSQPRFSLRRKSKDSDIVIVEDEVPEVLVDEPIPQVACHFFYPFEEDKEGDGSEGGTHARDPLAPVPEWVDCSMLQPEQVSVDNELITLERLPEKSTTSFGYVDPLCITGPIKAEPETENDVKPSLVQLPEKALARTVIESSTLLNFGQVEKKNSLSKNEISNFDHDGCVGKKRKNSRDLNNLVPPKKVNMGRKIGPKCATFSQKEKTSNSNVEQNSSQDVGVNTGRKIGPKCAKFRQTEKTNKSTVEQNSSKDIDMNTSLLPKKTNLLKRKVGPKCAKFRLKEKTDQKTLLKSNFKDLLPTKKIEVEQISVKPAVVSIGPKLPLPQCFQRKLLPSDELQAAKYDLSLKNKNELDTNFNKDHIVLKIYTCVICNHKCTDPLFHEAHVDLCSSKRHNRSLNLSFQECTKKNGYYKCEICIFKFRHQENLNSHFSHHGVKGFLCHICGLNFFTLSQLNQHTTNDHKNLEKVYSCNICEYSSQTISHLKEHMVKHNYDKHLFCYSCKQNYEDTDEFEKHREVFHKSSKIKSGQTSKIFKTENANRNSMATNTVSGSKTKTSTSVNTKEHPDVNKADVSKINKEETTSKNCLATEIITSDYTKSVLQNFEAQIIEKNGIYHCNGCTYRFSHLKNLQKHKKHHLKNKPFSCCNCSFVSLSYIDITKHIKASHESSKVTCSMCSSTFQKAHGLGKHMIRHINDGLYCYQCRKNLENIDTYRSHISSKHAGMSNTKYTCPECSFSAPSQANLKMHIAKHGKSKIDLNKFVLEKSNKLETIKNSAAVLEVHNRDEHEGRPSVKEECNTRFENEVLSCNKCTFRCSQPSMYIKQVKIGHSKRKFICNICRNDFAFLKSYLNHMKNHAACAAVYSCNECRFTSRKQQVFAKHMRTHALKRCPLCDYKTLRSDSFKSHLEAIHTIENDQTSSCDASLQIDANDSVVQKKESLPETLDSKVINKVVKHHTCCFCSYNTSHVENLRHHMALHFSNSSDSSKNGKTNNTVSKPSLTVKRWKSKSLPTRKAQTMVPKDQKILTLFYCCTQCEYKKIHRRSVASHLNSVHNIRGAVKNSTIKKIYIEMPLIEKSESRTVSKSGKVNKIEKRLETEHKSPCVVNKSVRTDTVKSNIIQTKSVVERTSTNKRHSKPTSMPWKCPSCDLEKLSLLAQLQHKKFGHMGFWHRSFSCKICGYRCADKANLAKHLKWKHVTNKNEFHQTNNIEIHKTEKDETTRTDGQYNKSDVTEKQHFTIKKRRKRAEVKCSECSIESFSHTAQLQHRKLGHDAFWDRPLSCDICEMRFLNKYTLGAHKVVHKKTLTCTKCNSFVTFKLKYLLVHKQTCTGFREVDVKNDSVSCTVIKHPSSSQGIENTNKDLNSDDDNFVCGECDFVTSNVIKFSTHMFIHSGLPDD